MRSKHPAAHRLLTSGLFDGLNSFAEIEARISVLPSNKEIGDAFEIFYNRQRKQKRLGYLPPAIFTQRYYATLLAA